MTRRLFPTIFSAILVASFGIYFLRTNTWFGIALLIIGTLIAASYFSTSFADFLDDHRVLVSTLLLLFFAVSTLDFYNSGNIEFALVFGMFVIVASLILAVDIWNERNFG